jgi:hypothetical protein
VIIGGRRKNARLEPAVFCADHSIPHEDCPTCLTTVAAMRPTVFAELAAAELRSGTECCRVCDFVYHEAVEKCPRCDEPHPFHIPRRDDSKAHERSDRPQRPVADLTSLTLRNPMVR